MQLIPAHISDKRVLIAALDWGMGHTTRCVALIQQLQKQNNVLIFAGTKAQREFMQREFPGIRTCELDGYNVTLDAKRSTYWQMFRQFQKISRAIKKEHHLLKVFVEKEKPDLIISDNRYGFFNAETKNILLTHQLNLPLPVLKKMVNRRLRKWIEKFDAVWIPDNPEKKLSGNLSNARLNIPVIFIGYLSRFNASELPKEYDYLGIVSGPEPERSRFAMLLLNYLKRQNKRAALVGITGQNDLIKYFPSPTTVELEQLINSSATVISRAGYTTIMELAVLEVNALLIPTPGQFEQEYLAGTIQLKNIRFARESEIFL